uniref:Uncharacterized protein n=1 Tax=Cucumis sativus TaxID=3659 RepID=A0A0A0K6V7_CUCSA
MSYVQEACKVTRHQDLIRSLSKFLSTVKLRATKWARTRVSVTIIKIKKVTELPKRLKNNKRMKGRNMTKVWNCVEVFEAAMMSLTGRLGFLED